MADLERLRPSADRFLRTARLTDAEFLYAPSLIAAAAFWVADSALTQGWLDSKLSASTSAAASLDIATLEAIAALIAEHRTPQLELVRDIDRRLNDCTSAAAYS